MSGMFEKPPYTPGMREVMKLSKAETGRLGHDYIAPDHYLLGIIRKILTMACSFLRRGSKDNSVSCLEIKLCVTYSLKSIPSLATSRVCR